MTSRRPDDWPSPPAARLRDLIEPSVEPATALILAVLAFCELFIDIGGKLWIGVIVLASAVVGGRRFVEGLRRQALLRPPPTRIGNLSLFELVDEEFEAAPDPDPATVEDVARLLRSRRLVVLCGQPLSGRAHIAHSALSRPELSGYTVLRPLGTREPGQRALVELLSARFLPRRRYALWLGDVGLRVMADLDPRIIERWLASGPGRVAIGWITPVMHDLTRDTRTQAAYALQRAAFVQVASRPEAAAEAVVNRYRQAQAADPSLATFMRVVATRQLLGFAPRPDAFYAELSRRLSGRPVAAATRRRAERGGPAPLSRDQQGQLQAHPALAELIEQELNRRLDPALFDALVPQADVAELVALARGLGLRGQLEQATIALERADLLAPDDPAVADAWLWLREVADGHRHGPSGVTLSRSGGFDYVEPPGPEQDRAARAIPAGDGIFDPTLPDPEEEGRPHRFYRRYVRRTFIRVAVLMAADFSAVWIASVVALLWRAATQTEPFSFANDDLWALALSATLVFWLIASSTGLYRAEAARAQPQQLLASSFVVSVVSAAGFFVVDADLGSLFSLPVMFATTLVLSLLFRFLYDLRSRRWVRENRLAPRVLLLGSSDEARAYATNMASRRGRPIQPVAFLSHATAEADPYCVGTYADLEDRLHELHIAEVALVDHARTTTQKADLTSRVHGFGMDVRFVASDTEVVLGAVGRISDLGLVHVPGALISPERLELKRIVDWLLVAAFLPAWAALIAMYAVYTRARHGRQPVLVTTERVGLGQVRFPMLRLRTRTVHPDGARGARPTGRVEAFLETSGLDELPQVVNVLKGQMSLVGPRPLSARDVSRLTLDQRRTLGARPGMTGRWQVTWPFGAGESDLRAVDADYLRRWRVSLDLEILLVTPFVIAVRGRHLGDTEIARRRGERGSPELRVPDAPS